MIQPKIGAQSYSFRNFDFDGSVKCLQQLGLHSIEYCAVHFPPDPENPNLHALRQRLQNAGIETLCFGVEGFTGDAAANRRKFEFAKAFGIGILTADPTPDSFDNLDALTEKFGIKIAIHNHGPNARYDKVQNTLDAVRNHSPLIGACVDTGHSIRSGEKPEDVIAQLGPRLISLHLKDWKIGGEETILGQGDMNMTAVARALKSLNFTGPLMMEYENSPDSPVPEMKTGLDNWLKLYEAT